MSVDDSEAMEYAETVWEKGQDKGFMGDYRYVCTLRIQRCGLFFWTAEEILRLSAILPLTALGVSVSGLAAVFALLFFLSARIVKPFSKNYEKVGEAVHYRCRT